MFNIPDQKNFRLALEITTEQGRYWTDKRDAVITKVETELGNGWPIEVLGRIFEATDRIQIMYWLRPRTEHEDWFNRDLNEFPR